MEVGRRRDWAFGKPADIVLDHHFKRIQGMRQTAPA
jgi:hypothetical protein